MTFNIITHLIAELMKKHFTGSITINFVDGSISNKIEKKIFETVV